MRLTTLRSRSSSHRSSASKASILTVSNDLGSCAGSKVENYVRWMRRAFLLGSRDRRFGCETKLESSRATFDVGLLPCHRCQVEAAPMQGCVAQLQGCRIAGLGPLVGKGATKLFRDYLHDQVFYCMICVVRYIILETPFVFPGHIGSGKHRSWMIPYVLLPKQRTRSIR